MKPVLCSAFAVAILAQAVHGRAQPKPPGPAQTAQIPEGTPAPSGSGGSTPDETEPKRGPTTPAAGYAYSDKPTRNKPAAPSKGSRRARQRRQGPTVNMPGFEQTADGGSRLFVQLSQSVPVEERRAQGSVTYVLKGASPRVWNNTNALVTVHFNTPVTRARLVPQGKDLLFVVELRAAVSPTWKMIETQDKTAMLAIDFPPGDFLAAEGSDPATSESAAAARPTPAKPAQSKRAAGHAPPKP